MKSHDTHIIIIESTRKTAEHLRDLLSDIGFPRVTLFASLDEARLLWTHIRPELAIIDAALQATEHGRRTISFLRAHYDIPFIMVADSEEEQSRYGLAGGQSSGCITRPYDEPRVRSAIENALSDAHAQRDDGNREIWSLSTLQALHDAVIVCDHERMITFMNPAAEALTGWKLSEVVHTRLARVFSPADPFAMSARAPEHRVGQDAAPQRSRSMLETKDGREIPIEYAATPVYNHRDAFAGYVIVLRDVRDRTRMEQQLAHHEELYRTLAETSRDLIVVYARDGRIEYVNSSAAGFFGTRPSDMVGKPYTDFFLSSIEDQRQKDHEVVFTTGEARRTDHHITVKGQPCRIHTWLIPLKDDDNAVRAVMNVSREATEEKAWQGDLATSAVKLQILNERKDRLLSILSHDLRSPFHALLGFCELLQLEGDRLQSDYVRAYTTELQRALRKQYELLENILAWSRIQLGEKTVARERFDLHAMVAELIDAFQQSVDHKQLKAHNNVPELMTVVADSFLIRSILHNLISNAVKFTPAGGSIRVAASVENDTCTITVRDTGIGIDADQLKSIFDMALVSTTPGTDNEPGTGLGLALCKDMIERHGGSISVDSYPGAGSTFQVTLPTSRPS